MTINEYFYTCHETIADEFRSTEHFEDMRSAVQWAASSSKGKMFVTVHSSLEHEPLEAWVNGSRFQKVANAVDYAERIKP